MGIFATLTGKKQNKASTLPHSAQDTLPFEHIYPNGVCSLGNGEFNKCLEFFDTDYQLADIDNKLSIFERFELLLNSFNDRVSFQFCYLNQKFDFSEIEHLLSVPDAGDDRDYLRRELDRFLKFTQSTSTLGLIKKKFLIFTIRAEDMKAATKRLNQIESQIMMNFKGLGTRAYSMNGLQRMNILFRSMNRNRKFFGNYENMKKTKKAPQDLIAPEGFEFGKAGMYKMGRQVATASLVDIVAEQLRDSFLTDILSCDFAMLVSIHIKVYPQMEAIQQIRKGIADNRKMITDFHKRTNQEGLIDAPIPPHLQENEDHLLDLMDRITSGNQKLFDTTTVVNNISDNLENLRNENQMVSDIVNRHNCILRPLNWQQERGFCSSLPLGVNQVEQERQLPSKALAIAVPFITASLFQITENSIYYGVDALLHKLIVCDRTKLRAPNGLVLGTPGSGKSFAVKMEIFLVILKCATADVLIVDPENEYGRMVEALNGTRLRISATSDTYINPFDITLATDQEDGDPLILKTDFIYSFVSLAVKRELSAQEESLIGRCIPEIYRDLVDEYKETGIENPDKVPILSDLCVALLNQPEKELAADLVLGLEQYVSGQFKVFNNRTNIDIKSNLVCFDIQELSKSIAEMGMLILQEQIWQRVKRNRTMNKRTFAYFDEYHLLLREENTAKYSVDIWKRFRKYYGVPTGITQNIGDFFGSESVESIVENTDFFLLLNQGAKGRDQLMQRLHISKELSKYVTNSDPGTGIVIYNNSKLPFINQFPRDNVLYRLMTTNPDDIKRYKAEDETAS